MKIESRVKNYEYETVDDLYEKLKGCFQQGKYFFLIDENVYNLYRHEISELAGDSFKLAIPAREASKTLPYLIKVYRRLLEGGFTRNDTLVTFGGGILQDLSGFIASTIYRGVKWIFVPTTLLAQADSCIGSKTSINFDSGKNQIGTFYPPDKIFIDRKFIHTLAGQCFNSGLGEIIKVHLMGNESTFIKLKEYLKTANLRDGKNLDEMVLSSLEIKKSYFSDDEFDTGRRNLLNYGHCFGHALESASRFKISHGQAVTAGIYIANIVARNRGLLGPEEFESIEKVIRPFCPKYSLGQIKIEIIIDFMKRDKKRIKSELVMVLLKCIGELIKAEDVKADEIAMAAREYQKKV